MSQKETIRNLIDATKEKGTRLTAGALIVLGGLGLAGCAETEAKPVPTVTQTAEAPTPTPTETATETPSAPEIPVSEVPKTRENWVINEEALIGLYRIHEGSEAGDFEAARTEVCKEFFANNPLNSDVTAPERLESRDEVEARFEARQQLLRDYISDEFRDDQWRKDINAYELLGGVELCVTNGVTAVGSDSEEWIQAIIDDKPLATVTTVTNKQLFSNDSSRGDDYGRAAYVTVAVEGQAPQDVWRRFLWKDDAQDWFLVAEQAENPYDYGWK